MRVHGSVAVPDPVAAIRLISSRDGAAAFRDIGRYDVYERKANRVHVGYSTRFGRVDMNLVESPSRVAFTGTAPLGVTFGGHWQALDETHVVLEQLVEGLPRFARPLVRRRVRRALEDLAKAFNGSS